MIYNNPNSIRKNIFRTIYDNNDFINVLNKKNSLLKFPFLVDIELTNYCNLKCVFCGQQTMTREKGFMEWEVFKKIIDECAIYQTPIRLIRWGEPFLHKDIIKYCKYIKEKRLLLHITNNGLIIKEHQMKDLIEVEVDSIIFSFQGATKEQYQIMRNNNKYNELVKNVKKIVKLRENKEKPYIHISSTMTNETKKEIDEFTNYWGNIVDSVGIGITNLSRLSLNQIKFFKIAKKLDYLKQQEIIKKEYRQCKEVYQKLSINWNGKVTCCCGDFDDFLIIGDIHKSSLQEIWDNSKSLKIFRNLLDNQMHRSLNLCSTCYHTYEEI